MPSFTSTTANHLKPARHPKPSRATAHHAGTPTNKAKHRAAHDVAAKPVHVTSPKKHPAGPARLAKSHR